jgi:hypothetical protein
VLESAAPVIVCQHDTVSVVASFHLVRHRSAVAGAASLALDRLRLRRIDGLRMWRLCGTGAGEHTSPGADLARTAVFALWDDEAAYRRFVDGNPWPRAAEHWRVLLADARGHGRWHGHDVVGALAPAADSERLAGPVAIITRADVRLRHWKAFRAAGRPVDAELQAAAGRLATVAIGEAPVGRQGTFSLWRSIDDARAFAYRQPHHLAVVEATRRDGWYGEEMFASFRPSASAGTWDGRDPLAPDAR